MRIPGKYKQFASWNAEVRNQTRYYSKKGEMKGKEGKMRKESKKRSKEEYEENISSFRVATMNIYTKLDSIQSKEG